MSKWLKDHMVAVIGWVAGLVVAAVMVGIAFADSGHTKELATDNELRIRSLEQLKPALDGIQEDVRDIKRDIRRLIRRGDK